MKNIYVLFTVLFLPIFLAACSKNTPTRYSLLTGEYAFRNNAAVLKGDAKLIIEPGRPTLPSMLKKVGYTTAVVGKWH